MLLSRYFVFHKNISVIFFLPNIFYSVFTLYHFFMPLSNYVTSQVHQHFFCLGVCSKIHVSHTIHLTFTQSTLLHQNKKALSPLYNKKYFNDIIIKKYPMGVLHSFSIKNIFYDKMDLRLFYFEI